MINFFNVGHTVWFPPLKCLSILLLQTSKTDNNALDIDAIYNLKLRKALPNSTDSSTTKLNAKYSWPPIIKRGECILLLILHKITTNYDVIVHNNRVEFVQ
jgi:hypothetical protein